ncbi:MAG: hypothetical protein H6581_04190 [Bacteroidia bacterium]|nr:hypothetical protein [Bacteroidia bacterium]
MNFPVENYHLILSEDFNTLSAIGNLTGDIAEFCLKNNPHEVKIQNGFYIINPVTELPPGLKESCFSNPGNVDSFSLDTRVYKGGIGVMDIRGEKGEAKQRMALQSRFGLGPIPVYFNYESSQSYFIVLTPYFKITKSSL